MASRQHLVAVNRVIRAYGIEHERVAAAAVEVARTAARMLDAKGADAPASLVGSYISAMRELRRAYEEVQVVPAAPVADPDVVVGVSGSDVAVNELEEFKLRKGGSSPG